MPSTVHNKARARKRLEGRQHVSVRIVVMRPGEPPAQREDPILCRERFIGADAQFTSHVGHVLCAIAECELVATDDGTLHIGREVEGDGLGGCIWRESETTHLLAIAALDAAAPG